MTSPDRGHQMRAAASIAFVVVVGCLVAACTGTAATPVATGAGLPSPTSAAGPGFSGDPCQLLSDDEIERITGQKPVVSRTAGPQSGIFDHGCDWEVGPPNSVTWSVQVGIITPGGRRYFDNYFAPFEGTPITGIGDVALQRHEDDAMAVKGDTLANVTVIALGKHDTAISSELLKLVVSRL